MIYINALINYLYINLIYYTLGGIFYLIDYYKCYQKIQIDKEDKTMATYALSLPTVLMNTFVYMIPVALITGYYDDHHHGNFDLLRCLIDIAISMPLIDIFFYLGHRIFHINYLYGFHKKHHEIIAPVGITAVYMSPIDMYFGNILPLFTPIYLLRSHPITVKIWVLIVLSNTICVAHSGCQSLSEFHDYHHYAFNKNYGTDIFMDRLFGTYHG